MSGVNEKKLLTFKDLLRFQMRLFMTIGEDIYVDRDPNAVRRILLKLYFYLGYANFNAFSAAETAYFIVHMTSTTTLLEATAVAPCIGFTIMTDAKQFILTLNREVLVQLLDDLEEIFPMTLELQDEYDVEGCQLIMWRVMIIFTILCMSYTTSFTFYPAIKAAIKYHFLGAETFERNFGFRIILPYDAYTDLTIYWITFWALAHCAYVAGISFVCVDLLLIMTITQCTMHLTYMANQLENYDGDEHTDAENIKFLQNLAVYHSKVLVLSERVNEIFRNLILWNFMSASLVICFAGFQLTAANIEDAILYFIFFTATLVQVFVICYYGDELVTSSLRIGDSAFNHNWLGCSTDYKRIMRMIMMRSQKPVSIRPPTFPPISFNTFMKVISMSYQFFALLRTTYEG